MSLLNRNRPTADDPRLEGLVNVGEVTMYPTDRRNKMTEPVKYEVFADRNNFAKVRYYRDPDGNLMAMDSGSQPSQKVEPLGVIRRHDPKRGSSQPSQTVERFEVTSEQLALSEILNPGSTLSLRKMFRMR